MSVESAFSSVESALPRPKRKAFTAALRRLRGETESEEDEVNRAVFGAQTFTKGTPFTLPLKVRKSCLFEKFCLYTRSGQIPVIHVELTPILPRMLPLWSMVRTAVMRWRCQCLAPRIRMTVLVSRR